MDAEIKKDIEEMNAKGMAFDAIVSALFDKHGMTEQATMFIMLNSNLITNRSSSSLNSNLIKNRS